MTPDDPRHGTHAGYQAHRTLGEQACKPCRRAAADYQHRRIVDHIIGRPRLMPSLGFRRRAEALQAIGWSINAIAERLDISVTNLPRIMQGQQVRRVTHERMCALYEQLSMTPPDDKWANRRRTLAARKGYAPPLAWDDIDRDAKPAGVRVADDPRNAAHTIAEFEHLVSLGTSTHEAAQRLSVDPKYVQLARTRTEAA